MQYPIFHSFAKHIQNELNRRGIATSTFTQWNESVLNATGLEIGIPLSDHSKLLKEVTIHFDWDVYRESHLAIQLPGMEKHPLLKKEASVSAFVQPGMDIEVTWNFDVTAFMGSRNRVDACSAWMEAFTRRLQTTYPHDDAITRWHIEIEGDENGRYLGVMSLITYLTVHFEHVKDLNELHSVSTRALQRILIRTNRILQMADELGIKAA